MAGPVRVFERSGDGLEFDRVAFFSDAIYAIAMTLLAVGIGEPIVRHSSSSRDFIDGLWDKNAEIFSFFLSFAVLGGFWLAHHRFISWLRAIDYRLRTLNLVYLAFVAFLPFPTLMLGKYSDNSAAVAFYAISVAIISLLETVMFRHAFTADLNRKTMTRTIANYGTVASAIPVVFFVLSVPVAFINPYAGMVTWALSIVGQIVHNRNAPEGAGDFFE